MAFDIINKKDIQESFNKAINVNPEMYKDIKLQYHIPFLESNYPGFWAQWTESGQYTVFAPHPAAANAGLAYLRLTNDPAYAKAKEILGREPTNKDMVDFIMNHEVGHIDAFKRGLDIPVHGDTNTVFTREQYKATPAEVYADTHAENVMKDWAAKEAAAKAASGIPNVETGGGGAKPPTPPDGPHISGPGGEADDIMRRANQLADKVTDGTPKWAGKAGLIIGSIIAAGTIVDAGLRKQNEVRERKQTRIAEKNRKDQQNDLDDFDEKLYYDTLDQLNGLPQQLYNKRNGHSNSWGGKRY